MDMNTLFDQAVSELQAEGNRKNVMPDSPEKGSPVYSFETTNQNGPELIPKDSPAGDDAGYGFGMFDPLVAPVVEMGRGVAAGQAGLGESFGGGMQWLGNRIGSDSVAEAGESIADYYKPVRESYAAPKRLQGNVMDDPSLLAKGDWWTSQIGNLAPSLGAAMIPGAAVGKLINIGGKAMSLTPQLIERLARIGQAVGAGAGGGAMEGSSTYREVLEKGGSEEEAARAGEMMSLASAGLNAVSFGKMFSKAGQGVAAKTAKHVSSGAVEGISEWAEEPTESISKDLAHYITTGEMKPGVFERVKQAAKEGVNVIGPAALTGAGGSVMSGPAGLSEETKVSDDKMIANIEQVKQGMTVDLLADDKTVQPEKAAAPDTRTPVQKMSEFYGKQEKILGKETLKESGPIDLIDSEHETPQGMAGLKGDIQERYRFKPEPELEVRIEREMAMRDGWRPSSFDDSSSLSPSQEPDVYTPFEREDLFRGADPEVVSQPDYDLQQHEGVSSNRDQGGSLEDVWDIAVRELEQLESPEVIEASGQQDALPLNRPDVQTSELDALPELGSEDVFDTAVQELQDEVTGGLPSERLDVKTAGLKGNESVLEHTDGQDAIRYEVRELEDVVPSHDVHKNFIRHPSYPKEAQERPYHSDAAEQQKVKKHASPLKPRHFINDNPTAASGPPIITSDGITLGGNSRIMSLALAYDQDNGQSTKYKNTLRRKAKQFGLKPEELKTMKNPVLVRVLQDEVNDLSRSSRIYNQDFTQGLDPKAEAVSRGRMLSRDSLASLGRGLGSFDTLRQFLDSTRSTDFVSSLKNDGVIEDTQHGRLFNKETGLLNSDGKDFVESTLRGVVVDNYDVLDMAPPSALAKLDRALPALIQANSRGEGWSLNSPIQDALRIAGKARSESISVKQFLNQGQLIETVPGLNDKKTRVLADALGARQWEGVKAQKFQFFCEEYAKFASMTDGGQGLLPGVSIPKPEESFDKAFIESINDKKEIIKDVSSTSSHLESDSSDSKTQNQLGEGTVSGESGTGGSSDSGNGERYGETGLLEQDDNLLHSGSTSSTGTGSDNSISGTERPDGTAERASGTVEPGRIHRTDDAGKSTDSRASGTAQGSKSGLSSELSGSVGDALRKTSTDQHLPLADKVRLQQEADSSTQVRTEDLSNIRETLPVLFSEQQEDVAKAEARFSNTKDDTNRGIIFTNGTGTGKTYTGLGVMKRFVRQGKTNIAVVVPTDKKAQDWIEDGQNLHLDITQLEGLKDSGEGIIVTSYANFGQNEALFARDFDLLVFDESHKLCENAQGNDTHALNMMHRLAGPNRPDISARKVFQSDMLKEAKKLKDFKLTENFEETPWNIPDKYLSEALLKRIDDKVARIMNTKVVFLSASPFAYDKTIRYADGFLFDSDMGKGGDTNSSYNSGSNWDQFMMSKFGYRMRYNKLTTPEAGVDSALMERAFNEWLKKKGALSGRSLNLDKDYSRQFVDVPAELGQRIQSGIESMWDHKKYPALSGIVHKAFDYHYTMSLLEALKAKNAVERVQQHLDIGRKVVVFHSRNKGLPDHPFNRARFARFASGDPKIMKQFDAWAASNPAYSRMDLRGLLNVRDEMNKAFTDKAAFFSGKESKRDRIKAVNDFNDDRSGVDVIVVQKDAGKEGISLHDKAGEKQRALVSLYLPTKPTDAIQTEGRIYRLGLKSDAVIEYLKTGLSFESRAFGQKISERAGAAENLAMGDLARDLRTAFREGYLDSSSSSPSMKQGQGGKESDSFSGKSSPFDQAKTHYYSQQKRTSRNKAREGADYFATPEPLGFKMAEWLNLLPGQSVLEPSAGHGAIARYFPESAEITVVEPSDELFSKMSVICDGRKINDQFETLAAVNKFDGIAMNPPFGSGGKMAVDHLAKAFIHLREGGRVVCILPEGPAADRKFDKWYESEEAEHAHKVAEFGLPPETFGRAGTKVKTRIVIIDKVSEGAENLQTKSRIDFNAGKVEELFERIQDVTAPERFVKTVDSETIFNDAGLELERITNSKGGFWVVTGETYANKKVLKDAGAKWNRTEKGWAFYQGENPLESIAQELDRLPASLGDIDLVKRSSYENPRRTRRTDIYAEKIRREYGLEFADGSIFEVDPVDLHVSVSRSRGSSRAGGSQTREAESQFTETQGIPSGTDSRGGRKRETETGSLPAASVKSESGVRTGDFALLDKLAGLFGKEITYVASDLPILPGDAHADLKQGVVFMRPDANEPHLFLLGHEIIHFLKRDAPALYNKYLMVAQSQRKGEAWRGFHKDIDATTRKAGGKGLSSGQANEELLGNLSGEQFMDPDFWHELEAANPTLFRRVARKIRRMIDKVLAVFGKHDQSSRYFRDIQKVRDSLVSVLAEYASQQSGKPSDRQSGTTSGRQDVKASKRQSSDSDNPIHFSKTSTIRNPTSVRSVRGAVQELQARAENALPLEVVSLFEDLPEHIRKAFNAQGGGYCEACNDPKTGKVWMVAENISSRKRAVELWMHEQGAHHGLRGLLGDSDYVQMLRKVGRSAKRSKEFKDIALDYDFDLATDSGRDMASHEYLAQLAEKVDQNKVLTQREKGVWRKVVDAVMKWLAKLRIRLPGSLTRREINRIVADAVFWTVQGDGLHSPSPRGGAEAVSYSRSNPVRESAMAKIGQVKEKTTIGERIGRIREFMATEFNQGMFDRFDSLKDLDKAAGVTDMEESAYVAARMSTSHADQIAAVIEHGAPIWREGAMDVEGEGLATIFEPVAHELDRFTGWLVGLRAKKLMAEGRENLFTEEEIDELCKLNSGREAQYEAVQKKYIEFKTKVLDFAQDAGVINAAGRTLWEHDEYIPFYRINETGEEKASVKSPHGSKGIANQYSGIRRLRGGTSNLGDPFENIIRNFSHLIDTSVKNRAMELSMVHAENIGIATNAEFKWEALKLKGQALRSSLVKVFGDEDAVAKMTKAQRDSLQTVFRMVKPDAKDVVSVLRDGKPVYYHIADPLLLRSLTSVNMQSWNNFGMKTARLFKRMLTTGITSTPDFMVRNLVRDTVHGWGVDRTGTFLPVVGSFKGAIKTLSKDEDTIKMMAAGAAFHGGYAFGHDPAAAKLLVEKLVKKHKIDRDSILDTPKKLANFAKLGWMKWQDLGSAFENATRARLYEGVKKKGGSHLEAAYEAKDIMDYSMGGDWLATRFLCETVPFFGARMVGLNRLGRGAYENPSGFMTKGAMVALASVLLYLNNRDREEFKGLEHWDRDNYYHFFVDEKHFRMPKPFEIGAIFGTLPERLTEYSLDGKDGDLLRERLQFMLTQTFSVGTPQIVTPILEQWADKSFFTGRAIVPMRLKRLQPGAQRDHRTSETAALIGEKTGTSPKRIEHLVNGYFGTLGVYVMSMADIVTREMVDAPELPSRRLDDMPLIKSFFRSTPSRHSCHLTELYDMVEQADELYSTVMNYAKTGEADKAKALVKDPDNRKILAKRQPYNQLRRALAQIETAMRQIHRSRKLTPDEKRVRIDGLLEKRNLVVRRVMK
ncbi:LPD38 domain-containing protein [Maridesulfovibrio frigidus]|uniref:LPD38 domain-containing protein n=1 Tax=Maridesulfovibrio frigidus TaxID=340956 RepID=UPI0004E27310|nr:LPD38 domain-containing protein [Maridesulfovibrio frigidus]